MTPSTSTSLIAGCDCRVSSVLNRNTKEVGKQFLFDNDPSSCWNSDQGTPQWVMLRWTEPVTVHSVMAQFQGGFCGGSDTVVEVKKQYTDDTWTRLSPWYLEDSSSEQTLDLTNDATTKTMTPSSVGRIGDDDSEEDGDDSHQSSGAVGGDAVQNSSTAGRGNETNSVSSGATNNVVANTNKEDHSHEEGISMLRLLFPSSTDFYGRIIMYKLQVLGSKVS